MTAAAAEYRHVPIGDLAPSPHNKRKRFRGIEDLAQSLLADGVLEPLLIRPASTGPGYEVLAGERRLRAAQHAQLLTVPCLIRDVDDETAFRITVVENLQRDALDPMEEAAGIRAMMDRGLNGNQIAEQIGRSAAWVSRRARLLDLEPCWLDAAEKVEGCDLWSVEHWELVARMSPQVQREFHQRFARGYRAMAMSVAELRERLGEFTRLVHQAPWKAEDASFPGLPACSACPQRSDCQPDLFADLHTKGDPAKDARCLDTACWEQKRLEHVRRKVDLAQAKSERVVVASDLKNQGLTVDGVMGVSSWKLVKVKKGEEPDAVFVDELGRTKQVKFRWPEENPFRKQKSAAPTNNTALAREQYKKRLAKVQSKRARFIQGRIANARAEWDLGEDGLFRLAAYHALTQRCAWGREGAPDTMMLDQLGKLGKAELVPLLEWAFLCEWLLHGMMNQEALGDAPARLEFFAEQLGLDYAVLESEAKAEFADPKTPKVLEAKAKAKPKPKAKRKAKAKKAKGSTTEGTEGTEKAEGDVL